MLRGVILLSCLYIVCNGGVLSPKVLDTNSAEYKKAFQDFLNTDPKSASFTPAQIQQYREFYNNYLKKNGINLIDSTINLIQPPQLPVATNALLQGVSAQTPLGGVTAQTTPGGLAGQVSQAGLPVQPWSGAAFPPQQLPGNQLFQPQQAAPQVSVFSNGLQEIGESIHDTSTHQANNVMSGINQVIRGTDEVLTEKGYQFQRLNSAGKDFLKQASKTKGSVLNILPTAGTRLMKRVENVANDPFYYANPYNAIRAFNPFRSKPGSPDQIVIDDLIAKLRNRNAPLHLKLSDQANAATVEWLRQHPDIFVFLLQPNNNAQLAQMIDNPSDLRNFLQELEAAKRR